MNCPSSPRPVRESLHQPLETGETVVARANAHARYPSRVQLIAAMNPCKCGHLSDPALACSRAPNCGLDYQARISGPLMDRIDVQVEVAAVSAADLALPPPKEGSREVAARIASARELQTNRYRDLNIEGLRLNAHADGEVLDAVATPDAEGKKLLTEAAEKLRLSARGYHRVLRLARTIADLEASDIVGARHIAEAASYRRAPITR